MKLVLFLFILFPVSLAANDLLSSDSIQIDMGIPKSNDTSIYTILRSAYALGYSPKYGEARWVSWNLNKDWFGEAKRYSRSFITDTSLPAWMIKVKHTDYTNSGYDRGHLVRSEERTRNSEDNKTTFLMTNIIPQTPELNRRTWLSLEYFCEDLCKKQNKELFIYAGPHFSNNPEYINGKAAVPDSCFKIIAVLEKGQTHKNISKSTVIFAVMMPNNSDVKNHNWQEFQRTVRQIEQSTNIDFFTILPQFLQDELENKKTNLLLLEKESVPKIIK